jgi:hypothetical protein
MSAPEPTGTNMYNIAQDKELTQEEFAPDITPEELWYDERLAERMPDDLKSYLDRWVTYWPRKGWYLKLSYDRGFYQPLNKRGKRDEKGKLPPLNLYNDFLVELVERHLDQSTWEEWSGKKKARYNSPNLWIGLNMPKKTTVACLDLDNAIVTKKDCLLGYYQESYHGGRVLPAVRLPLVYAQRIKRAYNAFPGRIWCISSNTLGLHAWEKFPRPVWSEDVFDRTKSKLQSLGLGFVEAHPMPGRCLRRPFGTDYSTITANGVIERHWWKQHRYFEQFTPDQTPALEQIITALLDRAQGQLQHRIRKRLLKEMDEYDALEELDQVRDWLARGCPDSMPVVVAVTIPEAKPKQVERPKTTCPYELDRMRHRRWPVELEQIASAGLPAPASLATVVHEMAKWLFWIELYHFPASDRADQIKALLIGWLRRRHNGYSGRALDGQWEDIQGQVERCIQLAIDLDPKQRMGSLELFARIRQKRGQGRYRRLIYVAPLLESISPGGEVSLGSAEPDPRDRTLEEDEVQAESSPLSRVTEPGTSPSPPLPRSTSFYVYPLPADLEKVITEHAGRNKVLPFAQKLVSYLWSHKGAAPVSNSLLMEFVGHANPTRACKYRDVLVKAGVIRVGRSYSVGADSKRHSLTRMAKEIMTRSRERGAATG